MRIAFAVGLTLALAPAYSQPFNCNVTSTPTMVRLNGASELVGDILLQCSGGTAGESEGVINITLFLNVNLTSKIMNAVTGESEASLLIDDPQPGVANISNGCPYTGQVAGTPGVVACTAGSGNVYQANTGAPTADNTVTWLGVPFVAPGPNAVRTYRLTNIRGNATNIGLPLAPIQAIIAVTSDVSFNIIQPGGGTEVAVMNDGLKFTSGTPVGAVGITDLVFTEGFPAAFHKRIENTSGGPLTAAFQDTPGHVYCTESGFTPEYSTTTAGAIGSADTGTRLIAEFSNLPAAVLLLIVPNEVTSSSGALVAHRVFPPFATDFTGGTIPIIPAVSVIPVSGHAAEVVYEVTASAPYMGVNGCAVADTFTVGVFSLFPESLSSATITGRLAPIDTIPLPSATGPRPRFLP